MGAVTVLWLADKDVLQVRAGGGERHQDRGGGVAGVLQVAAALQPDRGLRVGAEHRHQGPERPH